MGLGKPVIVFNVSDTPRLKFTQFEATSNKVHSVQIKALVQVKLCCSPLDGCCRISKLELCMWLVVGCSFICP